MGEVRAVPSHPFEPVYDVHSRILILGSFPSVRSRADGFYYAHPRNRFWQVLSRVLGEREPADVREKTEMLLRRRVALWDVLTYCEIRASSDASIRKEQPSDLTRIFGAAKIARVYTNGKAAHALYEKYQKPLSGISDVCLPSTSPANAAWSLERLTESWKAIKEEL